MYGRVAPGNIATFYWRFPSQSAPGPTDGPCVTWAYYSATQPIKDTNTGLVGPLITCKKVFYRFAMPQAMLINEFALLIEKYEIRFYQVIFNFFHFSTVSYATDKFDSAEDRHAWCQQRISSGIMQNKINSAHSQPWLCCYTIQSPRPLVSNAGVVGSIPTTCILSSS